MIRVIAKSNECFCPAVKFAASVPYNNTGIHFDFKRWNNDSKEADWPILPYIALNAL